MATELGQAYVQIMPSAKGISGMIKKQIDPEADTAGKSAGGKISTGLKLAVAAGAAAAGALMVKTISSSLAEGSKLQQSLGGIDTLFKGSAAKVKAYANEAYRTSGLSANAYMENVTSFSASLLQSMGGNTSKAADKANMAMVDMSDNANKMGTNIGDIQNAYQGFAKQNYTMLDNLKLGYGGTQEEMKRLLADATKITGVKYNMSNLSDVYSAIHAIQGNLKITGTTAKEAASTFSGSFDSMKSAASNVLGKLSLGMDIGPDLKALAQTTSTFLFNNFFPMVGNIIKALPGAVTGFISAATPQFLTAGGKMLSQLASGITTGVPGFMQNLQTLVLNIQTWVTTNLPTFLNMGVQMLTNIINGMLQTLPTVVNVVSTMINNYVTFLMANLPVILQAGKTLVLNLIDGILSNLPAIGQSAITAISKFVDTIFQNNSRYLQTGQQMLMSLINGIANRLPSLGTTVGSLIGKFIVMIISKLPEIITTGGKIIISLAIGLVRNLPKVVSAAINIGASLIGELRKINLLDIGSNLIKGLWKGISNMSAWIGEKIKGFGKGIVNGLKSFFGIHSPSRVMRDQIGRFLAEGIGVGISKYSGTAVAAMNTLGANLQDSVPALDMGMDTLNGGSVASAVVSHQVQAVASTTQAAAISPSSKALALLQALVDKSPVIDGSSVMPALAPFASTQQRMRQMISDRGGTVSVKI
ncbi:phage tail protein [Lacticaseibacillus salsurivasis]|uniref:phage tail protein n=1 Tax=Lacticaseibacillus salsurivasis TaxID=3081441 RepID=UPI003F4E5E41